MRILGIIAAAGAAAAGVAVLASGLQSTPAQAKSVDATGAKAPSFSAKATDGKTYSLESLTKGDKAVVLYFISHTCPINDDAVTYYNQIGKAYKGKNVNFVGVIDGDESTFKQWNKEHKVPFKVLYDPDNKIIKSYKALASPWVIVVDSDGEIEKTYKGFSSKSLQDISDRMAKHGKTKAVKINTKGAPSSEMFG